MIKRSNFMIMPPTMPKRVKTRAVERRAQTRWPNIIKKESRTRL